MLPLLLLALAQAADPPPPQPKSDRLWAGPSGRTVWKVGESATFKVQSPTAGRAAWRLLEGLHLPALAEGSLELESGKPATLSRALDHPGFLLLEVKLGKETALAAAAVEPGSIRAAGSEPKDFDSFWSSELRTLRAAPAKPSVTLRPDQKIPGLRKVVLETVEGRKAYAWVVVPEGKGPFPVVLEFPPYGTNALAPPAAVPGSIYALVSVHSSDLEAPAKDAYTPERADSRAKNTFKYSLLGGLRVLDWLLALPEADAKRVVTTGKSQGGGLAILAAGLDPRVTHLSAAVPAFGNHAGTRNLRPSGFPWWVWQKDKDGLKEEGDVLLRETAYYDLAWFARRFRGSAHVMVAWTDTVCPPGSILPAVNAFAGSKEVVHGPIHDHDWNRDGENWWPVWNARIKDWVK